MVRTLLEILAIGQVVLALLTALALLSDRRIRLASATSWLLLIAVVPVFGCVAFWLVGKPWLQKRRRQHIRRQTEKLAGRMLTERAIRARGVRDALNAMPLGTRGLATLAGSISGMPPVGGNEVEFFAETDELFARIAEDIDAATEHVHVLFYIVCDDHSSRPVLEAMERAARRGVTVRLLVDAIGSLWFARGAARRRLEAAGVEVRECLPAGLVRALFQRIDLRNHRKLVVVDNRIGYIGSHNLAAADFKVKKAHVVWVDATARIDGPAANELQRVFVEDWFLETDESLDGLLRPLNNAGGGTLVQVVSTGPTSDEQSMPQVIATCLHLAQRELILTTPYFVPDEPTMVSLITAARRGVKVVLVVPEHNDSHLVRLASRSYFQRLLDAGVELREFRGGMLHAKTITVDDALSVMTSANLDRRSFEINFEVSLVLYDEIATQAMRGIQESYLERSERIEGTAWSNRPWWRRVIENAVGLASPVL
jgi:cardiolipin synthase